MHFYQLQHISLLFTGIKFNFAGIDYFMKELEQEKNNFKIGLLSCTYSDPEHRTLDIVKKLFPFLEDFPVFNIRPVKG